MEEVRQAVQASQSSYDGAPGKRSFCGWRATEYRTDIDPTEYDDSVCLGIMVETAAAVENAERILSVTDLGFIFVGPNDLSVQYGVPGNRNAPEVVTAIDRIEEIARQEDVALGTAGHTPEKALDLLNDDYQVIRLLDEFDAIRTVFEDRWNVVNQQR